VDAKKNDIGKLRFDLIPTYPLEWTAEVYTIGSFKYDDNNWRKGMKWGRIFAAMLRHAWAWWRGEDRDPVDKQKHLASVVWCAMTLMEYERTQVGEDDRADNKSYATGSDVASSNLVPKPILNGPVGRAERNIEHLR
jgi:hypothetical protein